MFEIGYSEIFITALIALIVLGPERLPKAARLVGYWVRKARAQWYTVKAELENEIQDEELKRSLKESMADLKQTLNSHQEDMRNEMQSLDAHARAEQQNIHAALARDNNDAGSDERLNDERTSADEESHHRS